jgi:hypothetical protein
MSFIFRRFFAFIAMVFLCGYPLLGPAVADHGAVTLMACYMFFSWYTEKKRPFENSDRGVRMDDQQVPLWLEPYRRLIFRSGGARSGVPRALTDAENQTLEGRQCLCDWTQVLEHGDFNPAFVETRPHSAGPAIWGIFRALSLSPGCPRCGGVTPPTSTRRQLASGALVLDTALFGYVVEEERPTSADVVTASVGWPVLLQARLFPGNETGGREQPLLPEIPSPAGGRCDGSPRHTAHAPTRRRPPGWSACCALPG